MNYIKELNAFYDTLIFNQLSGSAIAVWHALMHFNNKSGWQASFSVPVTLLEIHSGIRGTTFKRARTELTEKGYIHVTSGRGNQAATYRMLSQIKSFSDTGASYPHSSGQSDAHTPQNATPQHQPDASAPAENPAGQNNPASAYHAAHTTAHNTTSESQHHNAARTPADTSVLSDDCCPDHNMDRNMDHNPVHTAAPLVKQDINKTQTKQNTLTTTMSANFYHDNFGTASPNILDDIQHWISFTSDSLVMDAMKRALEQNKPTWRYVKGILKSWQAKGIRTVEATAADDQQFLSRRFLAPKSRSSVKAEVIRHGFTSENKHTSSPAQTSIALNQAEWEECERLLAKHGKSRPLKHECLETLRYQLVKT